MYKLAEVIKGEDMNALKLNLTILVLLTTVGCASMGDGSKASKRQAIHAVETKTLNQLYLQKPDTKSQIENAQGYAVFSNANVNLLFVSAGTGYGIVNNNNTGKKTYMNMAEGGVGLGLGVKDYRVIIVFHTQQAIKTFVQNGWAFGGNADAAAKAAEKGSSLQAESYSGDLTVYTLTESGLALQATVKGTKFWPDSELNN
jgi:lipid-binding SYLF domain-containing protein